MNNNTQKTKSKKLSFSDYKKIALDFYNAESIKAKNEILEGLTSSQVQKLANIFFKCDATAETLFLLNRVTFLRYEENQKRKSKKFLRNVKKVYNY